MTANVFNSKNECNLLKKILLLDDPNKIHQQVEQQQQQYQQQKEINQNIKMNNNNNDEFARKLDLTSSSIDDYELQFLIKKSTSSTTTGDDENSKASSIKYLYKLLKFYKLDHYMSDLVDSGFVTPISLNNIKDKDLENLGVSAYDLRKFAKLQSFIKQVMNTLKTSTTSNKVANSNVKNHPKWESTPKKATSSLQSQKSLVKPVQKAKSSEFAPPVNSVNHPVRPQFREKSNYFGPKLVNHDKIQFVEMKSYNYGVPKGNQQSQATKNYRKSLQKTKSESKIASHNNHNNEQIQPLNIADIFVFSRKRPKLACEINMTDIVLVDSETSIIINESKVAVDGTQILQQNEFKFDKTFDSSITNEQLFTESIIPFIDNPSNRVDFNCICFGQTGSGKTHTLFGSKQTDGLCVMTAKYLFDQTDQKILCGFYEIYNGQLYDLFNEKSRLVLREDSNGLVNVVGLVETQIHSLNQLKLAIQTGQANRHIGCTSFNKASSRSHAVLQLRVQEATDIMSARVQSQYQHKKPKRNFRVLFIDLAGSERGIDAQNNEKDNRKEGAEINQSLLALKECIRSIDQHQTHAPFRQSKLTRVLRDCFIGSGRTVLIATVSPTDDCLQCSLNTLQYANRVRQLAIKKKKNYDRFVKIKSAPLVKTARSETDAVITASSKKLINENSSKVINLVKGGSQSDKKLILENKSKAILGDKKSQQPKIILEFDNSNFKPLDNNLNEKIKLMQQQQNKLFGKESSLFHPSKINMASTPIKTTSQAATNCKAELEESISSNDLPLKGFKNDAYFQSPKSNEVKVEDNLKAPKKSLSEIMQRYSKQLAQIYSPLSSSCSSYDEDLNTKKVKISEDPLSNSGLIDKVIKPTNEVVQNMLFSKENSKSELSSSSLDEAKRYSNGQIQLKSYIDNLEKKLSCLRSEMKDTPNQSKITNKLQAQKSNESDESTNSMKEISGNLRIVEKLDQIKLVDDKSLMTPNLSPVSTLSCDDSNSCSEAQALKKSLHRGSESLFEKVKALSNSISQENKKSLYEFLPIKQQEYEQKSQMNSTIQRTKSLLVLAHETQLSDVTETCKEEVNLLAGLRDCKVVSLLPLQRNNKILKKLLLKDFNEYLVKVEKMLIKKASSIRDLQIQISQIKSMSNNDNLLSISSQ